MCTAGIIARIAITAICTGRRAVRRVVEGAFLRSVGELRERHALEEICVSPIAVARLVELRDVALVGVVSSGFGVVLPESSHFVLEGIILVIHIDREVVDGAPHIVRYLGRSHKDFPLLFRHHHGLVSLD